jgi:hypothetical protein
MCLRPSWGYAEGNQNTFVGEMLSIVHQRHQVLRHTSFAELFESRGADQLELAADTGAGDAVAVQTIFQRA